MHEAKITFKVQKFKVHLSDSPNMGIHGIFCACASSMWLPDHTFFSSNSRTTVDYILVESSLVSQVASCQVHQHHPLNFSDHLPISMTLKLDPKMSPPPIEMPRPINWARAVENDDVWLRSRSVLTSILFHLHYTSKCQ